MWEGEEPDCPFLPELWAGKPSAEMPAQGGLSLGMWASWWCRAQAVEGGRLGLGTGSSPDPPGGAR